MKHHLEEVVDQILAAVEPSATEPGTGNCPAGKRHRIFTREGPWLVDMAE